METFTIGQLSIKANVNLETIRFYERRGLLPEPPRNKSGHRQYSIKDLRRTEFIKRTQSLGFSLQEISDLFSLRVESGKTCGADKQKGLLLYWMLTLQKNNIIFCHGEVFFLDRGLLMGA